MRNLLHQVSSILKNVKTTLLVLVLALSVMGVVAFAVALSGASVPVLEPRGEIARQQKDLLIIATLLMLIIVVPVFILTFVIALQFRATNTKAVYRPGWDSNKKLEAIWWGVPIVIISILAAITWVSSHSLDPYRPLDRSEKPLKIQVVALQWKWLFIYPEEQIASLNEVVLPVNRPVELSITSDAPMNSFWIPSLAGQVYAMSGMTTKLHVIGDTVGSYKGSSANISGEGFADMHFDVRVVPASDYERWKARAQSAADFLGWDEYTKLAKPSRNNNSKVYVVDDTELFRKIIEKYTVPSRVDTREADHDIEEPDGGTMEMQSHGN